MSSDEQAGCCLRRLTPPPAALRPPVPPASLAHRELLGGEFWQRIPAYANVSEAEFLDHKWQAKHSITNIGKLLAALEGLVSEGFIADAQRGFERAPMSVRVSPYLLSLIDWSNPEHDPLRLQFIPLGVAPAARSPAPGPGFAARARGHAGARADPPLRRQGAVPGAGHLPGLLPLLHAQLRGRHRHGRGGEVPAQGERRSLAEDVRLHPLAARAGGHRHLGRRRVPAAARADHADRRDAAVDRPHPADALRDQGAGGDAAEDPDRRRLDRRAHPRGRAGAQAAQGGRAAHALQPPARDHRDHEGGDGQAVRARHHRAQPERAAAAGQRQRRHDDAAAAGGSATSTSTRTTSTCTTS